jgi:hypothetical protein
VLKEVEKVENGKNVYKEVSNTPSCHCSMHHIWCVHAGGVQGEENFALRAALCFAVNFMVCLIVIVNQPFNTLAMVPGQSCP